jgi:hypothetical protein
MKIIQIIGKYWMALAVAAALLGLFDVFGSVY